MILLQLVKKKLIKNYILKEQENILDVVDIEVPVYVLNDTTHYNVDKFTSGKERKLKNILKKLPGIKVTKNGQVSVNGKHVNTLLVDGKPFFGGGSKLAVENIPAEAVDKIQAINNYNPVSFLKKVDNSDKLAMNIELKKDNNRFFFGEGDVGKGQGKYYKLHSSIFRYSPKFNLGFITSFNNTGYSLFSNEDYQKITGRPNSIFEMYDKNREIAQFNENDDSYKVNKKIGTLNFSKSFNKSEMSSFIIFSRDYLNSKLKKIKIYSNFKELINDTVNNTNKYALANLKFKHKNASNTNLWQLETLLKNHILDGNRRIISKIANNENSILNFKKSKKIAISQNLEWHNNTYENHVFSGIVKYNYNKQSPVEIWKTNYLNDFNTKITNNSHNLNTSFKYFRILNSEHQLSLLFTNIYNNTSYTTSQLITKNSDNNLKYNLHTLKMGISHRFTKNKINLTYGIDFKHLQWELSNKDKIHNSKNLILPKFNFKYNFSQREAFSLKYNLT